MPNAAEPVREIATLGSMELFTPKPDRSLWYFKDVLGMEAVHPRASPVYLRGYGDFAVSALKLTGGEAARHWRWSHGARSAPLRSIDASAR